MIPKVIHFIWMQGLAAMPDEQRSAFATWAPKHPQWEIKLWDLKSLPALQNAWVLKSTDATVQSDVARFEIVYQFGGVYLDCDMVCQKPIDSLVAGRDAFVSMRTRDCLASSSFGASKGHPWLAELLKEIGASRAKLGDPGSIRGPLERVTRRFPDIARVDRAVLEMSSATKCSVAVHPRLGVWKKPR
jgi:mannosyltransferase OCH1-like enzyme